MLSVDYSFLDFTVMPFLRRRVLSAHAAILFNNSMDHALWANAAGTELFGTGEVIELLETEFSTTHPLVSQIKFASDQITDDEIVVRNFRISHGLQSFVVRGEIEKHTLPDGDDVFLLVIEDLDKSERKAEYELAESMVHSLEGFADASAIVDEHGLPIASSHQFNDMFVLPSVLSKLVNETANENDRMVKRSILSETGKPVAAGIGRLHDHPGRYIVVLAEMEESSTRDKDTVTPPWNLTNPVEETEIEDNSISEITSQSNKPEKGSAVDRWYFKNEDIEGKNEPPSSNVTEEVKEEQNDEQPVRFAFSIGPSQIFLSVSPELQEVVGEKSGNIVGVSWQELSSKYGFDEHGSIAKLLEGADTWSGKTVLWPVENTDMVMPIDLAALPVFDKNRKFEGFRGFGIIRTADTILDEEARGMRLDELAPETKEYSEIKPVEDQATSEDEVSEEDNESKEQAEDDAHTAIWKTELTSDDAVEAKPEENNSNIISLKGRDFKRQENPNEGKDDVIALSNFDAPILVYNKEKTLFANKELLELAGFQSLEELEQVGGIDRLLVPFEGAKDTSSGNLQLKKKDGSFITVQPILKRVDWEGTNALCLTFKLEDPREKIELTNDIVTDQNTLDLVRVSDLENILETAADGILILENDGTIEALNSSGEALFAKDQADLVGTHFTELFAKESKETLNAYLEDLKDPNFSSILNHGREVIGVEANGGLIPIFSSIGAIGTSGRFCMIMQDLTERKKSEEELMTAKRSAETASEQKSEFLARMSHEIREPLNAIIGFSDIMIEERFGKIENQRYLEYLKDINRSGIHVLDLVNDLLDISKIEAGKFELSYEAIDLNQLASETVALLQPQANNRRIIIRTSLSRAVPKVVADARSIRQIILNLASNAIRHSPANSQVIVSTTFETNGEVALRVRDTGNGMNEKQLAMALEPFSQLEKRETSMRGTTGLGLPLTKALIEANRAYFDLESTPGEGTVAHVQFPSQRVLAD